MKVRYTAIYKIHGANKLPNDAERVALVALENPALKAILTTTPNADFVHIDKSAALLTQLLKGIFALDKEGPLEERLAAEVQEVKARRAKQTEKGVFLVLDGETEIPAPEFKHRQDTAEFGISLDDIPKSPIRESFRRSREGVITALSLSLAGDADRQIEKVGEVIYLVDGDTSKPIYVFNFQGGFARASTASPLTDVIVAAAAGLAPTLSLDKRMARPAGLLLASLERATGELQGFIAAWSALEIFVNATFKSTYEARWFAIMEEGAPVSGKPVFARLKDVMSDKYRLADKFLVWPRFSMRRGRMPMTRSSAA